jgi:hypothetical protein
MVNFSPKNTTSGFISPLHSSQCVTFDSKKLARRADIEKEVAQSIQLAVAVVPCSSVSLRTPAFLSKPSIF